ncbi:DUF305 domain-containing protein [Frateuria sp. GZRR33]|uniref:DUF305 domain-containing protein n=1 Tax=Frateuria sp. GZRR33 TaxID=3351535 RepID=UPI003EDBE9EC
MKAGYGSFAAMVTASTVVMFALMYFTAEQWSHVYWSQTRAYMALVMGAAMTIIMLGFMWRMYPRRDINTGIIVGALVVFFGAWYLARSQATVGDVAYMRAMIPHHSIAILTSERAGISDPRVRRLADGIIASQRREIGEMKALIADLEDKGK